MSCFAVATAWLFAAEALMVAGFGFPAVDIAAPDTLVLVQIIAIGWLSLCVCGALTQFMPVLVGKPVYSEAATLPVLCLLVAGRCCSASWRSAAGCRRGSGCSRSGRRCSSRASACWPQT